MKKNLVLIAIFMSLYAPLGLAGTACSDNAPDAQTVQKAFRLAIKTRDALEASGAEVAIIGRAGQDLSKYGLRFSHAAIVWRDDPQGRWLVTHELNQCGTASSALFNEGLANFFFDDMFAWDTLIVIPSPSLQTRIAEDLRNSARKIGVHHARYNMVAYPFSTQYQNSNQWVLELIADAQMQNQTSKPNRSAIQSWLKQTNYQPSTLHISALQRLGGRMFRANVAFDDHPAAERMAGKIEVVTVESIAAFIQTLDPQTSVQTLSLQAANGNQTSY